MHECRVPGRDMSYPIHVWEQPVPETLEEADAVAERLLAEPAGSPSSKLTQLVKTLWKKYPRDLDNDPEDAVWEDSFARTHREPLPVESLAIMTAYLDTDDPQGARLLGPKRPGCGISVNMPARLAAAVLGRVLPLLLAEMHRVESLPALWSHAVDGAQGRRAVRFKESVDAKLIAGRLTGARLEEVQAVHDAELQRYLDRLVDSRATHPESAATWATDEVIMRERFATLLASVPAMELAE